MNAFAFALPHRRLTAALLGLLLTGPVTRAELEWPPAGHYTEPSFPAALASLPIYDGFAQVVYTVDADGRLLDLVTVETNHEAFGAAIATVAEHWRFAPVSGADARASWPRRGSVRVDFRRTGTLITMTQRDASAAFFPSNLSLPLARARLEDLDAPLRRIAGSPPSIGDSAVLFIVDHEGKVRVPTVLRAASPAAAHEALATLSDWRFVPPTRQGRPVCVEAVRRFAP